MKRRQGFTLAELLVVISVITLLAMLLVPMLSGAWTLARTRLCANNLKRIGQAVHTWATEGESESWELHPLASTGWPAVVANYASRECLLCPEEDDELKEGTPVEAQVQILDGRSEGVPLVSLDEGGSYKLLKLSDTQWESGFAESARQNPLPYVPDGNPNVYWWGYDDGAIGRGDYDFQDVAIKVTKNGDGTATLWIQSWTAGHPAIADMDFNVLARHEEINAYYFGRSAHKIITLNVGGGSHYAMNDADFDLRTPGKLLALDYLSTTAYSTDIWDEAQWDKDEDGRPDFVRHGGRLNVLLGLGAVQTRSREDIDPIDVEVERTLWQR